MNRVRTMVSALAVLAAILLGPWAGAAHAAGIVLAPYGTSSGGPICDITGDISPERTDIACASGSSAFVGLDGVSIAFGLVMAVDPRTSSNDAPLDGTAY